LLNAIASFKNEYIKIKNLFLNLKFSNWHSTPNHYRPLDKFQAPAVIHPAIDCLHPTHWPFSLARQIFKPKECVHLKPAGQAAVMSAVICLHAA